MKKTLSILLVFILLFPATGVQAAGFSDVDANAWYADAVDYVVSQNLFQGTGGSLFSPDATMTRGMFITVLGRMAGAPTAFTAAGTVTKSYVNMRSEPTTESEKLAMLDLNTPVEVLGMEKSWYKVRYDDKTGYIRSDLMSATIEGLTDVPYAQYYAPYVAWAFQCGIATGTTSTTFSPDKPITREEICVSLTRYCSYYGLELPVVRDAASFTDSASITNPEAVQALQRAGIIEGRSDGSFDPAASVKRCEVAALFQRYGSADISAPEPEPEAGSYSGYSLFGNIPSKTERADDSYFDDACFIGHSLVVGMKNYFSLPNADFHAVSGISASRMLTYDRFPLEETYEDENGQTRHELGTIAQVLEEKNYGKIYIMLGVNELGPEDDHLNMFDSSMRKLVDIVRSVQPNASIYLISITPIGRTRSEESVNFNRENAIRFNESLQQISLDKDVYYLDAFGAYADGSGYMPDDSVTADGIHILGGKYSILKELLLTHAR
jgi:hypothetical protein